MVWRENYPQKTQYQQYLSCYWPDFNQTLTFLIQNYFHPKIFVYQKSFWSKKIGYKNFESKKFCTKNLFLDQHFFIQNIFLTKNVFGTKVIFGSNYFYDEILNLLINLIKSYLILTYCSNKIKTNFNGFWHNWNKPNFHLALRASGTVLRQVQGDILDKEIFY